MADIRILRGSRVQSAGQPVGVTMSTFGLERLEGITGADLADLTEQALMPAYRQVQADWPVWTGASIETLRIEVSEIGPRHARVDLKIGGAPLISDPRNTKHIDYAPYIEFNGSPGGTPPGTILYAMTAHNREMRDLLHAGVRALIASRLEGLG